MVPGIEDSPDPLLQFRMFFYCDAQYHRIGVNLHQVPVNCPFMAKSYASLNFDGNMRVDANHAGNKQYAPNSFAHKFRPDTAEAPCQVSDNIVSRKSHYWHEGKKSDYAQAKDLWQRVMSEQEKKNTLKNTANMLKFVKYPEIQVRSHFAASCQRHRNVVLTPTTEEVLSPGVQHLGRLLAGHLRPPTKEGFRVQRSREASRRCTHLVQGEQVQAEPGRATYRLCADRVDLQLKVLSIERDVRQHNVALTRPQAYGESGTAGCREGAMLADFLRAFDTPGYENSYVESMIVNFFAYASRTGFWCE